jgi:hypothetical protein
VRSIEDGLIDAQALIRSRSNVKAKRVLAKLWDALCDRAALQVHAATSIKKAIDLLDEGKLDAAVKNIRNAARWLEIELRE